MAVPVAVNNGTGVWVAGGKFVAVDVRDGTGVNDEVGTGVLVGFLGFLVLVGFCVFVAGADVMVGGFSVGVTLGGTGVSLGEIGVLVGGGNVLVGSGGVFVGRAGASVIWTFSVGAEVGSTRAGLGCCVGFAGSCAMTTGVLLPDGGSGVICKLLASWVTSRMMAASWGAKTH